MIVEEKHSFKTSFAFNPLKRTSQIIMAGTIPNQ
jgi:hypothetical protein